MEELNNLIFELKQKTEELDKLTLDVFTYDPRIAELTKEIEVLRNQIDELKSEDNSNVGNGECN